MVTENLSPALRAPASSRPYPKARRGYGKRSAPDQVPSRADCFALLPERERHIAGYIDHLPDGAAMDIKSLAKNLPLYGQMAVSSALKALGVAGHLRRVRCLAGEGDQVRWVSRTFWSRTAHDNEWWDAFLAATDTCPTSEAAPAPPPGASEPQHRATAAPEPVAHPTPATTVPAVPQQRTPESSATAPSPAYLALAQLGSRDPRLALSAADCTVLESLAAEWFSRGVDADYFTQALTSGLPAQVGSPVGLVRRRLTDKLPPRLPSAAAPAAPVGAVRRLVAECTDCGRPGPPEALPDGLCRLCRASATDSAPAAPVDPPAERDVHALVSHLRDLTRLP